MRYLTEFLSLEKDFPFAIYSGVGFSPQDNSDGRSYMHNHHSLEINFCLSGEGLYTITDIDYPILPGDLFIINNLEYHMARNLSGDLSLMVIVFEPELIMAGSSDYQYISAFYEWKSGFKHRLPGNAFSNNEIRDVLQKLQTEWDMKDSGWKLVSKSLLLMLLALLYRCFLSTPGYSEKIQGFQTSYLKLAPAVSYMEEHFKNSVSLASLAEAAHMSTNYFSALFSRTMDCTVSEYLLRLRLKNAHTLLTTTKESILSIALDSGFENISYFNRVFKREFSVTPGEYRNRLTFSDTHYGSAPFSKKDV